MAGWSDLPSELLILIVHRLVAYPDKVRFACVSTSWRSILPTISSKKVQPWLLLPRNSTDKKYEKFYSLHECVVHYLEVPEFLDKKFRGSSSGWLVSIEDSPKIWLINPIINVQINLPPRYKFPDVIKYCAKKLGAEYELECEHAPKETDFIDVAHVHMYLLEKVILSSSPTSSKGNFMAAAIYGSRNQLAFCKLGDKKWTDICKVRGYQDALFYEEKLYALSARDDVEVFDLSAAYPKQVETIEAPKTEEFWGKRYLVNTSIGLLQVHRYLISCTGAGDEYYYQTSHFKLYMYESSRRSWCIMKNIGENVIFLGLNTSTSITSNCLPPGQYYKGNCIYFTDDNLEQHVVGVRGGYDIGYYDLDSRCIASLRIGNNDKYWKWMWPTPIWYIHGPEDFIKEKSWAFDKDEDGTTELGLNVCN